MLFSSLLFLGASLPVIVDAACTGFQAVPGALGGAPNDLTFTRPATRSYVVSKEVTCAGSDLGTPSDNGLSCNATTCGLSPTPDLNINIDSELNITASDESAQRLLALVKRDTEGLGGVLYNFNRTQTVRVSGGQQICIPEGQTRYYTMTPIQTCVQGIFTGCSSSDTPVNGTAVEACGYRFDAVVTLSGIGLVSDAVIATQTSDTESAPAPANATFIENPSVDAVLNGASSLALTSWGWALVVTAALYATM